MSLADCRDTAAKIQRIGQSDGYGNPAAPAQVLVTSSVLLLRR